MKRKVFVNISNHPFHKWSDYQRDMALILAEDIVDIQMPYISPSWDLEKVREKALEIMNFIVLNYEDVIIHVVGEYGFVYNIVHFCAHYNIPCVYSTTERIVEELPDGRVIRKFNFVKFRHYF